MRKLFTQVCFLSLSIFLTSGILSAQSTSVTLSVNKDNSIYSENNNSNGAGTALFTGRTQSQNNSALRRALIQFDLSSIPSGATITQVELRITGSRQSSNDVSIHRVTSDWGEGSSAASGQGGRGASPSNNDATWNFNFFNSSSWNNAGGDFVNTASASTSVSSGNVSTWSGNQVIADVQDWVDGTVENFGWIIVGDESSDGSAIRMHSKESTNNAPELVVTFEGGTVTSTNGLTPGIGSLMIYPSITSDQISIQTETEQLIDGSIVLFNIQGKIFERRPIRYPAQSSSTEHFNVSNLPNGNYYLSVFNNGQVATRKFIVKQ